MFLSKLKILLISLILLNISGCGGSLQGEGRDFNEENLNNIELGMSEMDIVDLLGRPYSITNSLITGDIIYEYRTLFIKGSAAGFLYIVGVVDLTGSASTIYFDNKGKVEKIIYENTGEELYKEYRQ